MAGPRMSPAQRRARAAWLLLAMLAVVYGAVSVAVGCTLLRSITGVSAG
jgi:hypothetical protein